MSTLSLQRGEKPKVFIEPKRKSTITLQREAREAAEKAATESSKKSSKKESK